MSDALFGFCQFEFPWLLGPAPGRYVLREQMGEAPGHVLVVAELGAPQRRRLRGRRPRRAGPEPDPEPVATGRATVVDARRWATMATPPAGWPARISGSWPTPPSCALEGLYTPIGSLRPTRRSRW